MFGGGNAYLRPSGHLSYKALPSDVHLSERSRLKYRVTCEPNCWQRGQLLGFPSGWITCGMLGPLRSTPEPSFPWIGHLPGDLPHLWGILGTLLSHSHDTWGESFSQDHLRSCNECHPPSADRLLLLCCLSRRRQSSPSMIPQTLTGHPHCFQIQDINVGVFALFWCHLPWKDRLFMWPP